MFGLGFPELLIILVIILVIFGAGKLPQVGEALGKGLNKFRGAMDDKAEKTDTPVEPAPSVEAKMTAKTPEEVESKQEANAKNV
jgi:sec-independent protein translocase protein TatA